MEDKQIYTSSRSEEIKRQLVVLKDRFKKTLTDKAKKQKAKKIEQKSEVKVIEQVVKVSKEKPQNTHVNPEISKKTTPEKTKKKALKQDTKPILNKSKEKLFPFFVYTLFAIIIIIVATGIFLTYFKK